MGEQTNVAVIIGVMVIAVLLLAPPLVANAFEGLRKFGEDLRDLFFEDWGNFEGENLVGITLTIDYKNGTNRQFEQNSFSLLPLVISDAKGDIQAITASVSIIATHDAPETSAWSVEGEWSLQIQGVGELGDPNLGSKTYGYSTTSNFESGLKYTINDATIRYESGKIEEKLGDYGDYVLEISTTLSLTLNFGDGQTDTKAGTATLNWNFNYSSGHEITSLTVTIYNGKIR